MPQAGFSLTGLANAAHTRKRAQVVNAAPPETNLGLHQVKNRHLFAVSSKYTLGISGEFRLYKYCGREADFVFTALFIRPRVEAFASTLRTEDMANKKPLSKPL